VQPTCTSSASFNPGLWSDLGEPPPSDEGLLKVKSGISSKSEGILWPGRALALKWRHIGLSLSLSLFCTKQTCWRAAFPCQEIPSAFACEHRNNTHLHLPVIWRFRLQALAWTIIWSKLNISLFLEGVVYSIVVRYVWMIYPCFFLGKGCELSPWVRLGGTEQVCPSRQLLLLGRR